MAGYGQILRGGEFTQEWTMQDVISLAQEARGTDPHGYRSEFIGLAQLAESMMPIDLANSEF